MEASKLRKWAATAASVERSGARRGRGHGGARGHGGPKGGRGRSLFGEEFPLDLGRGLGLVAGILLQLPQLRLQFVVLFRSDLEVPAGGLDRTFQEPGRGQHRLQRLSLIHI